ncbi:MAG: PbpA [Deltaproteobacteria bacterium]|nr:PbpA [Deltaproteobacteria bacterium]
MLRRKTRDYYLPPRRANYQGPRPGWREYQIRLKRTTRRRKRPPFLALFLCMAVVVLAMFIQEILAQGPRPPLDDGVLHIPFKVPVPVPPPDQWPDDGAPLAVNAGGGVHKVFLTLDPGINRRMADALDKRYSEQIAVAALEPRTGRVVVLTGWTGEKKSPVPAVSGLYPAASIFKIVTAAAAMEECGMSPDSRVKYNGMSHTLYKTQLKDRDNRYTNRTTLCRSFARSVNPVFGKLGGEVGADRLVRWATHFGFNRKLLCTIDIAPSVFEEPDTPYALAEVACGFNRRTRMTALHAALVAAAVANNGVMPRPVVVERVEDPTGRVIHRARITRGFAVCRPETAEKLRELMAATVKYGTASKAFYRARYDEVLRNLEIGGKTGSINNADNRMRFDWFVGYASAPDGRKLALAVIVAHGEYLGPRAATYARMLIRDYFGEDPGRKA